MYLNPTNLFALHWLLLWDVNIYIKLGVTIFSLSHLIQRKERTLFSIKHYPDTITRFFPLLGNKITCALWNPAQCTWYCLDEHVWQSGQPVSGHSIFGEPFPSHGKPPCPTPSWDVAKAWSSLPYTSLWRRHLPSREDPCKSGDV